MKKILIAIMAVCGLLTSCSDVEYDSAGYTETVSNLRAEYEQMVVEHFENYGYLIAYIEPWKWFISCDPSRWENE